MSIFSSNSEQKRECISTLIYWVTHHTESTKNNTCDDCKLEIQDVVQIRPTLSFLLHNSIIQSFHSLSTFHAMKIGVCVFVGHVQDLRYKQTKKPKHNSPHLQYKYSSPAYPDHMQNCRDLTLSCRKTNPKIKCTKLYHSDCISGCSLIQ